MMNDTLSKTGQVSRAVRQMARRAKLPALLALCALPLGACRYTTFPLAPAPLQGEFPARVVGTLTREGEVLVLNTRLAAADKAGFLTVVWFREDNELARDRVYLDPQDPAATFRLRAPEPGYYRAVIEFEGKVLRQFEIGEIPLLTPAPPAAPTTPAAPGGRP